MTGQKFKVGSWVKTIASRGVKYHVLETLVQTCPGGVQYHVTCRPYMLQVERYLGKDGEWITGKEYAKFNEVELEPCSAPELPKEKGK